MKNFKRILLAVVAVFAVVLLVGCGAKSDNGTYVYKPTKSEVKEILGEQGVTDSSVEALLDQVKLEVSVTIKDKKGSISIKGEALGNKMDQSYEVKVDQKAKTLVSENEYGKAEITYQVSGNVLTIKDVKNSLMGDTDMFNNYMKIAKFKKVK